MYLSTEQFTESLVPTSVETKNQYFPNDLPTDYTSNHTISSWSSEMSKVPPEAELEQIMRGIRENDSASMELFFRKMYPSL